MHIIIINLLGQEGQVGPTQITTNDPPSGQPGPDYLHLIPVLHIP